MKIKTSAQLLLLFFLLLVNYSIVLPARAQTSTLPAKPKVEWQPATPKPEVDIPGLQPFTSKDILTQPDSEGYVFIPFIGQYIAGIFRWALLIAGLLTVILIIFGGFIYLTSSGNAQRAKDGRDRIVHALLGFVILLISYTLLYVIDPNLVSFKSLKIKMVERKEVSSSHSGNLTGGFGPACTGEKLPSQSIGIGIANFGPLEDLACGNRSLDQIKYLVIHEGGGDGATINILAKRRFSTHFVIERNGKIVQAVDLRRRAIHAGSINAFSVGVDLAISNKCNQSSECVKDEKCSAQCSYEPAQYASLNELINFLAQKTKIIKDDKHIIAHCQTFDSTHGDIRNLDWTTLGLQPEKHRDGSIVNGNCIISFTKEDLLELKKKTPAETSSKNQIMLGCCHFYETGDELNNITEKDCKTVSLNNFWEKGLCQKK